MSALTASVAFLKPEEGCVLHPYQDVRGVWTIGYGNTTIGGLPVTAHTPPLTQARADALLTDTVAPLLAEIQKWVGHSLTDAQWASLVSFAYNLGASTLYHSSLLTAVRKGYLSMAAGMFAPYCHAGGRVLPDLVHRRAREAAAFGLVPVPALAVESDADKLNDAELAREGTHP